MRVEEIHRKRLLFYTTNERCLKGDERRMIGVAITDQRTALWESLLTERPSALLVPGVPPLAGALPSGLGAPSR